MSNLAHDILYFKSGAEGGRSTALNKAPFSPNKFAFSGFTAALRRRLSLGKFKFVQAWRMSKSNPAGKPGGGKRLAASSLSALMIYGTGAALSYASQVLIARIIGAESFGIYAYVFAWVTMLGYLATLGFHVSLLRFIPAYRAVDEWPLVHGITRYSQRRAALAGLGIVAIGSGIIAARFDAIRPELALTFLIGILTVPIVSQHLISASLVRSFGGIARALAPERVVRDGVLLAVVALLAWSGLFAADAKMAMGAALISALATLLLLRIFLRPLVPVELNVAAPAYAVKDWLKPTFPIMFIVIADSLMNRSGVIVLGLTGKTTDAGIFAVGLSMAVLTGLPRMAVAAAFAPNVSDLFARNDHDGLQKLATKASVLSLIGALLMAVPLLVLLQPLLLLFGPSFAAAAPIVAVLVFGQVLAAACGPQQHLITMTGNEKSAATIMMICALANLAGCVVAIKIFGTFGAALAMTATLVAWNIAMAIYIHRRLHLVPGLIFAVTSKFSKGSM
jgi:O-antigen/teichoic acid export membrane protein